MENEQKKSMKRFKKSTESAKKRGTKDFDQFVGKEGNKGNVNPGPNAESRQENFSVRKASQRTLTRKLRSNQTRSLKEFKALDLFKKK